MRYRLRILPAADADVDAAALFIAADSLKAALRFYDEVDSTFQQIVRHPSRAPVYDLDHPILANLRKCSVTGFRNYLIFYRVEDEVVEVIRVLHGSRDIPAALTEILNGD